MTNEFIAEAREYTQDRAYQTRILLDAIKLLLPILRHIEKNTSRLKIVYRMGLRAVIAALEGYIEHAEAVDRLLVRAP